MDLEEYGIRKFFFWFSIHDCLYFVKIYMDNLLTFYGYYANIMKLVQLTGHIFTIINQWEIKMKDMIRQISVIVSILATIVVNGLANALPINGLNTGQISDRFNVYFVPAGYVFSIWGLIYLGLIAYLHFPSPTRPAHEPTPARHWLVGGTGWFSQHHLDPPLAL